MGIVVRLLCISLLVGICLAGAPQQPKAQAPLEPRMTEISKLSQQIKAAQFPYDNVEDCDEPPPRRCRRYQPPHNSHDPNSPGWVRANAVGIGELPDDVQARLPKWIPARTVPFLPEQATGTAEAGSPCCVCPQCGLSFYTPNDYWGHLPTCPAPGPRPCIQTSECLGDSHFDSDPRVCMCRPGRISSSAALTASGVALSDSSSSSTGESTGLTTPLAGSSSSTGESMPLPLSSSTADAPPMALNGSLIATGSIGEPLTGGGVPFMLEASDIEQIGEQIGQEVAEAIESGTDNQILGS